MDLLHAHRVLTERRYFCRQHLFAIRTNSLMFVSSVRKSARTLTRVLFNIPDNKKEIGLTYLFFISKGEIRTLDLTGMSRALSPTELPCHNLLYLIVTGLIKIKPPDYSRINIFKFQAKKKGFIYNFTPNTLKI